MILEDVLRGLQGRVASLRNATEESVTGRRISTVSDSPIEASWIMSLDNHLRAAERYQRAAATAKTRLSTEEAALESVQTLLGRAKSLAIEMNATTDAPTRAAALDQVREIRSEVISLGNTRLMGEYILGGARSTTAPFEEDGTYVGDSQVRYAEIDSGVRLETNHTGDEYFAGALDALGVLVQELETGTSETMTDTLHELDRAQAGIRMAEGEIAARIQRVLDTEQQLADASADLLDRKENLQEADPTESLTRLSVAQAALEQAYTVVGQVLKINIINYI
jgi:flagellar hook-associated protein 3 FlgL